MFSIWWAYDQTVCIRATNHATNERHTEYECKIKLPSCRDMSKKFIKNALSVKAFDLFWITSDDLCAVHISLECLTLLKSLLYLDSLRIRNVLKIVDNLQEFINQTVSLTRLQTRFGVLQTLEDTILSCWRQRNQRASNHELSWFDMSMANDYLLEFGYRECKSFGLSKWDIFSRRKKWFWFATSQLMEKIFSLCSRVFKLLLNRWT